MDNKTLLGFLERYHTGRQRAISSSALAAKTGVTSREIRNRVNELRVQGEPICSGDGGYFIAATDAELTATIRQLQSRVAHISRVKNGLARARTRFADQQTTLPV